jgi:uncharacterized membrane protein HdeD (DUF308 family)
MSAPSSVEPQLFEGRSWVVILRGLTAIAFGVLAIAGPGVSMRKLALLFGVYALLHGGLSIAAAIGHRGQQGCVLLVTEGLVGIVAGTLTLRTRTPSPMAFVFLMWLWAIGSGLLRIAEAVRLRERLTGDMWLMLSGAVTLLFGVVLMWRPVIGVLGLAVAIAASALIWGVSEILLGWQIRAAHHHDREGSPSVP